MEYQTLQISNSTFTNWLFQEPPQSTAREFDQTRFPSRSRPCEIVASACLNLIGLENFMFILRCKTCGFVLCSIHSSSCMVQKPRTFVIFTTLDEWNAHFVPRFTMFCVFADKSPTERPKKDYFFSISILSFFEEQIAATSPKRLLGSWQEGFVATSIAATMAPHSKTLECVQQPFRKHEKEKIKQRSIKFM